MPSEITLGESMRVRCRGRVLRVIQAADNGWKAATSSELSSPDSASPEIRGVDSGLERDVEEVETTRLVDTTSTKIGVAVCLNGYEYLASPEDSSGEYRRISALHSPSAAERNVVIIPESPRASAP
jgi:hypothetical protein